MNIDFNRRLSIAPMLDCTDRHERYFLRLLSKHILLYSEMVVSTGLLHCENKDLFLGHEPFEHPAVLQLGGSNPADLAAASKLVEAAGFSEVNLNCGCPSDRVQNGNFGACLMKEKNVVADCFKAMQDAVSIPVSIKCRIGVDDLDSWEFFTDFIQTVHDAGCKIFIVHARKAWLKGLSPKEKHQRWHQDARPDRRTAEGFGRRDGRSRSIRESVVSARCRRKNLRGYPRRKQRPGRDHRRKRSPRHAKGAFGSLSPLRREADCRRMPRNDSREAPLRAFRRTPGRPQIPRHAQQRESARPPLRRRRRPHPKSDGTRR